ncbi:MAG: Holliday junction branch migration protein RuvA [Ruminococcaceae bacterium]|jgi:Holliday junction DNA helicase RuvA|nr:Holliday junction branch migration protein RuvA [Oscillospiraceae bacterium]
MIETLYGQILELDAAASSVTIECAGVGFRVTVTSRTLSSLPAPAFAPDGTKLASPPVRIWTHLALREDAADLYGFADREELTMYRLLLTVSGVGPKAGLSILSLLPPKKLAFAVANGDTKAIAKAPGVGEKTAAMVVLKLKDKIPKQFPAFFMGPADDGEIPAPKKKGSSGAMADARDALAALGYSRSEIASALKYADEGAEADEIIRTALAVLLKT